MNILDGLEAPTNVKPAGDYIKKSTLASALYNMVCDVCYLDVSKGGAKFASLKFVGPGGVKFDITEYITGGTAKKCLTTFVDKRTGETRFLPGFEVVNNICMLTVGKQISQMNLEEKVLDVYDFDKRENVKMKKMVMMELKNQPIILGINETTVWKQVKNQAGVYVNTDETKVENSIDKVFRAADGFSRTEADAGVGSDYISKWKEQNAGILHDRTKKKGAAKTAETKATTPPEMPGAMPPSPLDAAPPTNTAPPVPEEIPAEMPDSTPPAMPNPAQIPAAMPEAGQFVQT